MATIETRLSDDGTKSYRVKIRLKGRPTECATFARITDARRWAQTTEAAIREGRHFKTSEAKRHTFGDMVDRYIKEVVPLHPNNAANTVRQLGWWKTRIGDVLLSDIGPALIVQYRNELSSEPRRNGALRANATILRYLASISHAYTIAMKDWAWVEDNPVLKISKPRAARGRERYLSDIERDELLATCRASTSRFLYTAVVLAISTGMRRGELFGLQWNRVDLQRGQILLNKTKNDTSRSIPLVGMALQLLTDLAKTRRTDTDLVFYGKRPTKQVDLTKPWTTAMRKAGIKDFRFHDLRHSCASYLAMNGATSLELAAVLGHKTLQMVKRYSHLANSHTSKVVASMNDKIFGAKHVDL